MNVEDPEAPRRASLAELMAIAKRASHAVERPFVDHGELLFDEYGLPK